jgi:formylmethanofuran dehydrogenase subunit E
MKFDEIVVSGNVGAVAVADQGTDRLRPYFEAGAKFHGYLSPGLALGIIMVDLAKELLGQKYLIDAVVETKSCLPDAIQLMTSCTYGNGWMHVKDWNKMALTLYDKYELEGIRVFVNYEKVKNYPLIERWLMMLGEVDKTEVASHVIRAGRDIVSWQKVKVAPIHKRKKAPLIACPFCGETYPVADGEACARCSGKDNYYHVSDAE